MNLELDGASEAPWTLSTVTPRTPRATGKKRRVKFLICGQLGDSNAAAHSIWSQKQGGPCALTVSDVNTAGHSIISSFDGCGLCSLEESLLTEQQGSTPPLLPTASLLGSFAI